MRIMAFFAMTLAAGIGCQGMNPDGLPLDNMDDVDMEAAKPVCSGKAAVKPGTTTRMIDSGGMMRSYRLHVPTGYDPVRPTPVALIFHGFTGTAPQILQNSRAAAQADKDTVLVAAPQGVGNSWNAGPCCGQASSQRIDDVGLVAAILDELERDFCVDQSRIMAAGMSNGGFFSNRLGCELSDRIGAIGPVAGGLLFSPCSPKQSVAVMYFHAKDDLIVPYDGGGLAGGPSAMKTWQGWADRDGCSGAAIETYSRGKARCQGYAECRQGTAVTLCTTDSGGHSWPGSGGGSNGDIDATAQLFQFLLSHPRSAL